MNCFLPSTEHKYYCGVDRHTRSMYLCVLDAKGTILLHRNLKAEPAAFLDAIEPFRKGLVVAVECMFTWYWLADLCSRENITFVLGHALYMKAIHGGKIGNVQLKWAFSEAAVLFLRKNEDAKLYRARLVKRRGKAKSLTILAHKIARAVYFILKRKTVFEAQTFFA